ncbi:hypothetical protein B0I31_104530 [Saccharothrix carnea]|uniref:Effector-associated domain-containing protein n=1 Tax=Saccharothrix carnea TaxID=1280637 RepID=A0A2P8ICQ1_SACCR|nr:hypothetical protein [Saccharothrix carnea]PSL56239.1 hypothetical protein B0I31_104530 [Saccharothrix carnea]
MGSAAVHRSFVVVDVESYGDSSRTSPQRTAVRDGMYQVLMTAFADCDLPWDDKSVDDVGDSLMVLLPADVPKSALVDRLPERVVAALREHNHVHADGARLRLRMAVHAGEVHFDEHGKTSAEMIFTYRILDAPAAKQALKSSTATLVLIASDPFYQAVIRHAPAARPADFEQVEVTVKEVHDRVWVRLVDGTHTAVNGTAAPRRDRIRPEPLTLAELGRIVDALLETPGFDTREGRDLVLALLDRNVTGAIARHSSDRADVISIVRTCWRYERGPEALLDSLRFHAGGTTALSRIEALFFLDDAR